jgi:chemotaxis protein methyltransferase CheR
MAILFREEGLFDRTLFYATDINPDALRAAEAGIYPLDRIRKFTENHQKSGGRSSLSDYYTADYGRAVFDKSLRANVVFSDHSLVTDAVFAEMQLISCRNVMIYFDRGLQDRAVGLFQDSLARNGFLGIGSKENLRFSRHAAAFSEFVPAEKIYRKREP